MFAAVAALLVFLGIVFAVWAFRALVRTRIVTFLLSAFVSLLLLVAGGGLGLLALGIQGMQALTHEETAARIRVVPTGAQRYQAKVAFADGRVQIYDLAGDDVYVDAHIVKWTPLANMLGLHTSYRLDRIGGRYRDLAQENTATRTIYTLGPAVPIDLVSLRRRFLPLATFFDAEYGSATFVPVAQPGEFELRVTTSGLLLRPVAAAPRPGT